MPLKAGPAPSRQPRDPGAPGTAWSGGGGGGSRDLAWPTPAALREGGGLAALPLPWGRGRGQTGPRPATCGLVGWLASGVPPGGLGQGRRRLPDGRPAAQAAARKASPVPGRGAGGLPERAAGRSA